MIALVASSTISRAAALNGGTGAAPPLPSHRAMTNTLLLTVVYRGETIDAPAEEGSSALTSTGRFNGYMSTWRACGTPGRNAASAVAPSPA